MDFLYTVYLLAPRVRFMNSSFSRSSYQSHFQESASRTNVARSSASVKTIFVLLEEFQCFEGKESN